MDCSTLDVGFLGGSVVRICLRMQVMQETQVRSLDQEDPLEEGVATHSSIFPGESYGQHKSSLVATVHGVAKESVLT